jgi:hypothetical protein
MVSQPYARPGPEKGALMSVLYFCHHLGLGDHIICNAIVRDRARRYDRIVLPAKPHNIDSVAGLLRDLGNVSVVPVRDDADMLRLIEKARQGRYDIESLGRFGSGWTKDLRFDEMFYRQAGLPFMRRWTGFQYCANRSEELSLFNRYGATAGEYALIHDEHPRFRLDSSRIDRQIRIRRDMTNNICEYGLLLEHALEIHVLDSAFMFLADSIPTRGRLYVHRYARPLDAFNRPSLQKRWTILEDRKQYSRELL